jgi:Lrp/AsnC family transcriptional regulator for asnA, asnC and gidA
LKFKNNSVSLDDVDLKILQALQEDSRQTFTAIGESLGLAHSTVYDRIRRMEERKVIRDYTAMIDAERAGLKTITALVTVCTEPKETERVAERLAESPEALEVYTSLSEELLIIAKVVAADQDSLHDFIANSIAPLRGVLRIRTSIITKKLKESLFSIGNGSRGYVYKRDV